MSVFRPVLHPNRSKVMKPRNSPSRLQRGSNKPNERRPIHFPSQLRRPALTRSNSWTLSNLLIYYILLMTAVSMPKNSPNLDPFLPPLLSDHLSYSLLLASGRSAASGLPCAGGHPPQRPPAFMPRLRLPSRPQSSDPTNGFASPSPKVHESRPHSAIVTSG